MKGGAKAESSVQAWAATMNESLKIPLDRTKEEYSGQRIFKQR